MMQDFSNSEMNNFTENEDKNMIFSDEIYRCVFDSAGDAMLLSDKDSGQILEANKTAVKMYGFEKEEFSFMKISDLSDETSKTSHALKTELNYASVKYHKKKSGIVFPVEITDTYFNQSDKNISVVIIKDFSDRIKVENALFEKNKEMEQLIYITSHDFRAPLLNIKGYSSELKTVFNEIKIIVNALHENKKSAELSKFFDEDIPEALTYIDSSCIKMNTLIEDLLKVSHLSQVK